MFEVGFVGLCSTGHNSNIFESITKLRTCYDGHFMAIYS
jgi:hypothetical protein